VREWHEAGGWRVDEMTWGILTLNYVFLQIFR